MATKGGSPSIAKKLGMALTGLLLYGFLVGHLAGNLLLLKGDGGEQFNAYSGFLTSHPLLIPTELILLAIFILHLYLALSVWVDNRRARPVRYQKTRAVGGRSWASSTMIYSGLFILIFAVLHVMKFKYGDRGAGTLYDLVMGTFQMELYAGWYMVAMIVLGFHLWHAFQSALQTLGLYSHKRLRSASAVLSLILAGGFGIIPFWAFFIK